MQQKENGYGVVIAIGLFMSVILGAIVLLGVIETSGT